MANISSQQARAQFTSMLIAVFSDMRAPTSFLRSMFPSEQAFVKYLSIEVMRNYENIAVDVARGSEGNTNTFAKSTEKTMEPPLYNEKFNMTEIDLYDRLFGNESVSIGVYTQLMQTIAQRLSILRAKIERAYEKQCADVLLTGVVTLVNSSTIDFRRKAASMVNLGAGNYWADANTDPFADLGAACKFLRQTGKSGSGRFRAIIGETAFDDLYANAAFKSRVTQNLNNNIDTISAPVLNSEGGVPHGILSCGSWKVELWTYPQTYDVAGVATQYIDPKKFIVTPTDTVFKLGFAAVPQILTAWTGGIGEPSLAPIAAQPYVVDHFPAPNNDAHWMRIKSAGIAIPVSVDRIYTGQAVA